MFPLRRAVIKSADRVGAVATRVSRRYASGKASDTHHGAHHGHHATGPKTEPLGTGFYIVLGLIPASIALYSLSKTSPDGSLPALSKLIDSYSYYQERWVARNALHTKMVEQAAFDRQLFQNSRPSTHVDLRFPEIFNNGSPYNNIAGHRARNVDEVMAHYERLSEEEAERKVKFLAEKKAGEGKKDS